MTLEDIQVVRRGISTPVATIEEEDNRLPTWGGISHAWRALRHPDDSNHGRVLRRGFDSSSVLDATSPTSGGLNA
jgi:hypothetical protein